MNSLSQTLFSLLHSESSSHILMETEIQKEFGRHTVNIHGQVQKTEEFIDEDQ